MFLKQYQFKYFGNSTSIPLEINILVMFVGALVGASIVLLINIFLPKKWMRKFKTTKKPKPPNNLNYATEGSEAENSSTDESPQEEQNDGINNQQNNQFTTQNKQSINTQIQQGDYSTDENSHPSNQKNNDLNEDTIKYIIN